MMFMLTISSIPLFLAQEIPDLYHSAVAVEEGFNWMFLFSPAVVWVWIPITAILVGTVASIIHRWHQHQERMAMIAAGLHPDYPPGEEPLEDDDSGLRATAAHR